MRWWDSPSGQNALREFQGEKWTLNRDAAEKYGLCYTEYQNGEGIGDDFVYTGGGNSGYQAINLAFQWGAEEVILGGFTMAAAGKQKHWHPDHRDCNPTPNQLVDWGRKVSNLYDIVGDRIKIHGKSSVTNFRQTELMPKCRGVIGVARSGGWVTEEYPVKLHQKTGALILTDFELDIPHQKLKYSWPGWWSKMEVFSRDIEGDWLYMDMDTIVIDHKPLLEFGKLGLLGDYFQDMLETGVMYLPEWARWKVWDRWIQSPEKWMDEFKSDGAFIRDTIGAHAVDLRKYISGLHSYKVDGLKSHTRLLIYHGSPRPHETRHFNEL